MKVKADVSPSGLCGLIVRPVSVDVEQHLKENLLFIIFGSIRQNLIKQSLSKGDKPNPRDCMF